LIIEANPDRACGSVLVTGAARGLGAAIAIALAERGVEPILLGRSAQSLAETADAVGRISNLSPRLIAADVAAWDQLEAALRGCIKDGERLWGVVNNAGIIDPIALVEECDPVAFARCISINLIGTFNVLRACLPLLAESGIIANMSSGAADAEHAGWSAYSASKAALERLSATLAAERPDLTVVAVRPGVTDTGMQQLIRDSSIDNAIKRLPREDLQPVNVPAREIARLFVETIAQPLDRSIEAKSINQYLQAK
jgi:NAD(P)-dependent dehydrogenase (short-subunit alcohol dehydrogenase family)